MVSFRVACLGIFATALATSAISIVHERKALDNLLPDMEDLIFAMKKADDTVLKLNEAAQIFVEEYDQIKDLFHKSVDDIVNIYVEEGDPKVSDEEFAQLPLVEVVDVFHKLVKHILGQKPAITSSPLITERIPSFPKGFIDGAYEYAGAFMSIVPSGDLEIAEGYYLEWKDALKTLTEAFA